LTNDELTSLKKVWLELGEISCSKLNNYFIIKNHEFYLHHQECTSDIR